MARFQDQWQEFLKRLFDLSGGVVRSAVTVEAIVAPLAFDVATTTRVVEYLLEKGFIRSGRETLVCLTAAGLDALQGAGLI